MSLTADTITDEQIREIRDQALANMREYKLGVSNDVFRFAMQALGGDGIYSGVDCRVPHGWAAHYIREGRARCAEILSSRMAKEGK